MSKLSISSICPINSYLLLLFKFQTAKYNLLVEVAKGEFKSIILAIIYPPNIRWYM